MVEPARPGTVTILFTDLVSSTQLLQREGDEEAQAILKAHQQLLRDALAANGGHEVKWLGDGLMVAFPSAADAVNCAIEMQQASQRQDGGGQLAIRVGLNVGEPLRDEADYFGTAVVVAKRLCDSASGGAIVCSSLVAGLLAGRQAFRFRSIGRLALKGISEPVAASEVVYDRGAPAPRASRSKRFTRVGLVIATAVIAGCLAAGGLYAAGAFDGGGTDSVRYQEIVANIDTDASLTEMTGDCQTNDLLVNGTINGNVSGDIQGTATGTFEARLYAKDNCRRTNARSTLVLTDNAGDSLTVVAQSLSVERLVGIVAGTGASQQTDRAASVVTAGTGRYAGFTGKGTCAILAFISQNAPGSTDSTAKVTADCTLQIARTGDAEPVIMHAATSEDSITLAGRSSEVPYEATVAVLYRNNRDQPQQGLSLRVPVPEGVQLKMARAGDSIESTTPGAGVWELPDLPPGGVGEFEFVVQLISADSSTLALVPEIRGRGLDQPATSEAVTLRVVR